MAVTTKTHLLEGMIDRVSGRRNSIAIGDELRRKRLKKLRS